MGPAYLQNLLEKCKIFYHRMIIINTNVTGRVFGVEMDIYRMI